MGEHVIRKAGCGKCGWACLEMAGDMNSHKSEKCPQCGGHLGVSEFSIGEKALAHIKERMQTLDASEIGADLKEGLVAFFSDKPATKRKKSWF